VGVKHRYSDSMSEEIEIAGIKVPQVDWAATPASIQALVVVLSERLQQQDDRIRHLEERLNQNSPNPRGIAISVCRLRGTADWT
jgi:hypothetical protein